MMKRHSALVYVLCLLLPLSALASPGAPCPNDALAGQTGAEAAAHPAGHHGASADPVHSDHAAHATHPGEATSHAGADDSPCDCCKVCADRCAALGSLSFVSILDLPALTVAPCRIGVSNGGELTEDPDPHGLFRPPIIPA